jgi:integrase
MPPKTWNCGYNRSGGDLMEPMLRGKNVRVREDGTWHYRFNFRGREYSGPTGLAGEDSNRSAAEEFAQSRRAELKRFGPAAVKRPAAVAMAGGSVGFGAAAAAFLTWAKDVEYAGKASTAERIRVSFVSVMEFFGELAVSTIGSQAIEAYKEHRLMVHQVRPVTVRHDLHALSIFFGKYASKRGMCKGNPVKEVSIPTDLDAIREHVITSEEERVYFAAAESLHATHIKTVKAALPNLRDVARLMLEQGARPEELVAARKEHYDAASRTLRIAGGKSKAARRVLYLTEASCAILERRSKLPDVWLFPSSRRPGHHVGKLNSTHDRVCIEAGVAFVLYDWRHTFATRAIEAGVPAAVVAAIMGHASLRTIGRYVHPTGDAQRFAMDKYEAESRARRVG